MRQMDRRRFLGRLAAGTTAWATAGVVSSPRGTAPDRNGSRVKPLDAAGQQLQLREPAFRPLPLGSIAPRGWLA
ncbi:MAG: twin-arginine translocation signal domain-containing protein, partial [Gemmatimonadales bacterium]